MGDPRAVAAAFDVLADQHDDARWNGYAGEVDQQTDRCLNSLAAARPNGQLLALGSGTGWEAVPFLDQGWSAVLVDASPEMTARARTRLARYARARIRCRTVDDHLNLEQQRHHVVTAIGETLSYLPAPGPTLRLVQQALVPGGSFLFTWVDAYRVAARGDFDCSAFPGGTRIIERTDPELTIDAWTENHLLGLLEAAGLEVVDAFGESSTSVRRCWLALKAAE